MIDIAVYPVHEWVDDRVGDVVGEVEVEDDDVVWNQLEHHEKGGEERDNKDDGDNEQHHGCPQVRSEISLRPHPRRSILWCLCFGTALHDIAIRPLSTENRKVDYNRIIGLIII